MPGLARALAAPSSERRFPIGLRQFALPRDKRFEKRSSETVSRPERPNALDGILASAIASPHASPPL
jgi:hypothetical protein